MHDSCAVRRFEPFDWPIYMALRLRSLAESPDAFGSLLELEQQRSAQEWEARLSAGALSPTDLPLLAECNNTPSGLAWARIDSADPSHADLYQMWVAPEFRGRGLGAQLLQSAITWAHTQHVAGLRLGVTVGDTPAMRLYRAAGFRAHGAAQPLRAGSAVLAQPMYLRL